MVNGNSEQNVITTNFKSRYQKQGGSHLFAYYYENKKEKFFIKETRETGIFRAFFHLTKNFSPGRKNHEPQRF